MKNFIILLSTLLFIGCGAGVPSVEFPPNVDSSGTEIAEQLEVAVISPIEPEDVVPQIMSQPSNDELLIGIAAGQTAPFSGVLLNVAGAAWLESEPDATQERCQLFLDRRLGEVRTVFGARLATLELTIRTQTRVQTIELENRDLQINSLEQLNEQLRNSSGQWWEQVLWIGGSLIVGTALGIIFSLFAN